MNIFRVGTESLLPRGRPLLSQFTDKIRETLHFALLSINNYSEFRVKESTAAWTFTVKSLVENLYFFQTLFFHLLFETGASSVITAG